MTMPKAILPPPGQVNEPQAEFLTCNRAINVKQTPKALASTRRNQLKATAIHKQRRVKTKCTRLEGIMIKHIMEGKSQRVSFCLAFPARAAEMSYEAQAKASYKLCKSIRFELKLRQLKEAKAKKDKEALIGSALTDGLKPWSRLDKRLLLRRIGEGQIPEVRPEHRIQAVRADNSMTGEDGNGAPGAGGTWNFNFNQGGRSPFDKMKKAEPVPAAESQ